MLNFANPYAILLLPLPWLISLLLPEAPQSHHAVLRIPYLARLKQLMKHKPGRKHYRRFTVYSLYAIWSLCVLAATGPQWLGQAIEIERRAHNIMLAIDISGSMQIPDMEYQQQPVDRLSLVKAIANEFIQTRKNDRLGLILFGTRAYLQTPLTFDRNTLSYMLNDASIGLAGPQTAMGDAIGLAIKRLKRTPDNNRVLIVLTDGANNAGVLDPIQASKIARENNIKIYTIGLGASRLIVPGILGSQTINPSEDLDLDTLKTIAKNTDGLFFRAKNSEDLKQVYRTIDRLVPVIEKGGIYRPKKELYIYPLLLALLLSWGLCFKPRQQSRYA